MKELSHNSAPDSSTNHFPIYNDLHQKKRLSVREIARKFDQRFTLPSKLFDQVRLKEIDSLEKLKLVEGLRDAMESLSGRVDGKNKDNVAMVDALALHEGEEKEKIKDFIQEGNIASLSTIEEKRNLIEEKDGWVWVDSWD